LVEDHLHREIIMGMRVGSGGQSSAMAQIQMAQASQQTSAPKASLPVAAMNAQNVQMQSVMSLIRGQGSKVDVSA
jgi:hypothetical protein